MSAPAFFALEVYQGDSEAWAFSFWSDPAATVPLDLEGYEARAEIRAKPGAPSVLATLSCEVTLPNVVTVRLPPEESAALSPCSGSWDLEVSLPGAEYVRTLVAGPVTVTAQVTEAPPVPDLAAEEVYA